jgi:O-antigen/teichoic acid export membrane protein
MAAFAIGGVLFATPVLTLWVGPDMASQASGALRWFAVGMAVNGLAHVPFAWLQGQGRADLTAKFHLVEAPLHLILLVWMVGKYSVEGAAIAWAIRSAVDLLLLAAAAAYLQGREARREVPA